MWNGLDHRIPKQQGAAQNGRHENQEERPADDQPHGRASGPLTPRWRTGPNRIAGRTAGRGLDFESVRAESGIRQLFGGIAWLEGPLVTALAAAQFRAPIAQQRFVDFKAGATGWTGYNHSIKLAPIANRLRQLLL